MTMVEITHPRPGDTEQLVSELSTFLQDLSGDDSKRRFDVELTSAGKDAFVVLRLNDKPVACSAICFIDRHTCEIKRMFCRQKDMGKQVLLVLENKAKLLGYTRAGLATPVKDESASKFYLNNGYRKIAAFGEYKDKASPKSLCLGKHLYRLT